MDETFTNGVAANGNGSGHDNGFSFSPDAATRLQPPVAPSLPELRAEIREILSGGPALAPEDASLLALMALHDAGIAAALAKLPERDGVGGATLALLARKYRGAID